MRFDSFSHMLSHRAEMAPDAPAIRYGGHEYTYGQLWAEIQDRAGEYRAGGKTCLGVLADGSLDCVVDIFAANIAGL